MPHGPRCHGGGGKACTRTGLPDSPFPRHGSCWEMNAHWPPPIERPAAGPAQCVCRPGPRRVVGVVKATEAWPRRSLQVVEGRVRHTAAERKYMHECFYFQQTAHFFREVVPLTIRQVFTPILLFSFPCPECILFSLLPSSPLSSILVTVTTPLTRDRWGQGSIGLIFKRFPPQEF